MHTHFSHFSMFSGSYVEVIHRDGILDGFFFQKEGWRRWYERYPEIILIDSTYRVNNLRMPLYIVLCVDGNGQSQMVALWIVKSEDRQTILKMFDILKQQNDTSGTKVVMADKDWIERDVAHEALPQASLLICLFHTLRTFGREISERRMPGLTQQQKAICLEVITNMAYSASLSEYEEHYQIRIYTITDRTCTCGFHRAMALPCRHILAFRKSRNMALFAEGLCGRRWSRNFYLDSFAGWSSTETDLGTQTSEVQQRCPIPSELNKFKTAQQVCSQLAGIAAEMPLRHFIHAIATLKQLASAWENGLEVALDISNPFGQQESSAVNSMENKYEVYM
jgi:hypothetical protein